MNVLIVDADARRPRQFPLTAKLDALRARSVAPICAPIGAIALACGLAEIINPVIPGIDIFVIQHPFREGTVDIEPGQRRSVILFAVNRDLTVAATENDASNLPNKRLF